MESTTSNHTGLMTVLCIIVLLITASAVTAQISNVTLQGTVKDSSGAVVPGATVTATNTQTGVAKSASADQDGHFNILNVVPGVYDVQAARQGFATALERNQQFLVGTTVTLDFSLEVSTVNQTIEVSAQGEQLDTTQSTVSKVVEPTTLDSLPTISRSFSDLAALSPGVLVATTSAATNSGLNITIGDATSYQTGYVVDGTTIENNENGGQIVKFTQDWIQEFSLVSENPPAEFAGASGGFVNAVSLSGTNEIHGRIYGYYQNSALNATPAFATTKLPTSQRRIGGMVGGPIRKDKLFYFLGYENWYNDQSVGVTIPAAFVNPAALITSGTFPQISKTTIAMAKLNYTINPNNTIWVRWNYEFDHASNNGVGAGTPVGAGGSSESGALDVYAGAWDRTLGSNSLNEIRVNYNRRLPVNSINCISYLGSYMGGGPLANEGGDPVGYWATITYPNAPGGTVSGRCGQRVGDQGGNETFVNETFSHTSGHHQLKFGGDMHRWQYMAKPPGLRNQEDPQLQVAGTAPFTFNLATATPPTPTTTGTLPLTYVEKYQRSPVGGPDNTHGEYRNIYFMKGYEYGWFAQDSWQTTKDLTLNLGLRYDIDLSGNAIAPYVPAGHNGMKNTYDLIAPRFGYAWAPFGDKKTVFRGGIGLYYDKDTWNIEGAWISDTAFSVANFNLNANLPAGNPYCFGNTTCASGVPPFIDKEYVQFELAKALVNFALPTFPAPGTTDTVTIGSGTSQQTLVIPAPTFIGPNGATVASPVSSTNDYSPNFTVPGELQVSSGVAHQFSSGLSAAADFVYVRGFRQIIVQDVNVNPATFQAPVNPLYTQDLQWNNNGMFVDRSLRVQFSYRTHRGDSLQVAYSLGWADDDTITSFAAGTSNPSSNPFNPKVDYGPSANDARHILNASGTIHAPWGIAFSPIVQFNSPLPYTATTTGSVVGCPAYYSLCYPTGYSKNTLRGADTIMVNGRLSKTVRLGEKRSVTLFFEGYNLINHRNYGINFVTSVLSTSFGHPTAVATPMRQFQVGGRFDF